MRRNLRPFEWAPFSVIFFLSSDTSRAWSECTSRRLNPSLCIVRLGGALVQAGHASQPASFPARRVNHNGRRKQTTRLTFFLLPSRWSSGIGRACVVTFVLSIQPPFPILKGAPRRLTKPLSDQFPVRVCSCPLCIINRMFCFLPFLRWNYGSGRACVATSVLRLTACLPTARDSTAPCDSSSHQSAWHR